MPTASAAVADSVKRVPTGSAQYNAILEFLIDEAEMLDEFRLNEWVGCLAEDIEYVAPVRQTRARAQESREVASTTMHYGDNFGTLVMRVKRFMETKSAWSEDPVSRTRRFVTNLRAYQGEKPGEYDVKSYLLIARNRFESTEIDLLTAERRDRLRRVGESFKIVRREILIDMSVLGWPNLAVFL